MADETINDQAILAAAPATDDYVGIWDTSASALKRITPGNLVANTVTGGGIVATGGFTLTVPATGTAALLGTAQTFTAQQTMTGGLHVQTSDAGAVTAATFANDAVFENDSITGISLLRPDGNSAYIVFGSPSDNDSAYIRHIDDEFVIYNNTSEVMRINSAGQIGIGTVSPAGSKLDVNDDSIRIRTAKTPASATATGVQGQLAWDANFLYVCVATNSWKRVGIASW